MKGFFTRNISLLILFIFISGCNTPEESEDNTSTIEVGSQNVLVEIADAPQEWELGLSYRDTLAVDHGMLFVFANESRRVFWMRGCYFDIDLAYIESDGTISEIITMEKEPLNTPPESLKTYPSQSTTIKYALEMIGGWFEEHNVDVDTEVNLEQISN
ncbi:DUF192 domain-containing protein [candidate division WOR-3 bacterium]|nr:DUF192 domain-containing protein [candidate division WOR-3 bacterium]